MNKDGVILIGLNGVGKTLLLNRLQNKEYVSY